MYMEEKTKSCYICKEILPHSNFRKDSNRSSGLMSRCKKCDNNYTQQKIRKKRETDPLYDFKVRIRKSMYKHFKRVGVNKNNTSTQDILGIDYKGFREYIENQFTEGMSWDNHGEWHYDHIIPLSSAKDRDEVIKLNHYSNFQPLWAKDNIRKSNNIIL